MFIQRRPATSLFLAYLIVLIPSGLIHLFDSDFAGALTAESVSADIAAGEKLYKSKACMGCHGKAGKKPQLDNYPVLAYQNALYLEEQTKMIRDGQRSSGMSSIMSASVQGLTDEEIKQISLYLASQR
jgi:cytochrome c